MTIDALKLGRDGRTALALWTDFAWPCGHFQAMPATTQVLTGNEQQTVDAKNRGHPRKDVFLFV